MAAIDRSRVKRSFGRQASEYDRHADIQKKVINRFLEILRTQRIKPERILDVGTGTGTLLSLLPGLYRDSSLFGIDLATDMTRLACRKMQGEKDAHLLSADAERLPFADNAFDLVLSTSTFQWLERFDRAFAEVLRVLAPGGVFCFALFGERTLYELKGSYRQALESAGRLREDQTHASHAVREVEKAMLTAGFLDRTASTKKYLQYHESVPALLRALKHIGAGNAAPSPARGLANRKIMLEMIDIYQREFCENGFIRATYEVIYATGRKGHSE
jgi:malonyl-CoA O-methyltransferase